MTVISVQPKYGGLSGSGQLAGIREYMKVYVVITDSDTDGVMRVGNALGLPRKGWVYTYNGETDPGALCWNVDPVQDSDNQRVWEVTCQYSSDMKGGVAGPLGGDPRYDVDNPLAAPPEVTWGSWVETEVATHDIQGNVIANAAGCPYLPPPMKTIKRRLVTIVRNEAVYPVALDQAYAGSINSDLFYSWPPNTALLEDVTATAHFAQAMLYWRVRYDIRFKKPDWHQRIADAGTRHFKVENPPFGARITNDDGTLKLFDVEDDGVYSTNIVFLNGDGTRMSQDDVKAGLAHFEVYEMNEAKPFAALNL